MSVTRTYRCDLCGDGDHKDIYGPKNLVGLHWSGNSVKIVENYKTVEHQICVKCLSCLQEAKKFCGQGYDCSNGPKCGSDHK